MNSKLQEGPFWWGVANAAFQVEGDPAESDWTHWTKALGKISDKTDANKATDFWKSYEQDFDLAKDLGSNMFRISIAWERIEPAPGEWDEEALNHYEKMIQSLRKRNIEPMVTLHHFVLPNWLAKKGGLESEDFSDHFTAYALKVIEKLSWSEAKVRWWITFNEPIVLVTGGYVLGEWPPGKKNLLAALKASRNLARAHNCAVQAIRKSSELPTGLKLGIAYHWREMKSDNFGIFSTSVEKIMDWVFNTGFLNAIKMKDLDYLGINYYGKSVLHFHGKWPFFKIDEGEGPTTDLGWVIHPEGLGKVLEDAFKAYHLPLIITENGLADATDSKRPQFLKEHIDQIRKAQEKNIPVIGYLHWSLTDNFEWAKGLAPRFGLVEIDYETGERKPRSSFEIYKQIIKNGI
jgi:beta-glucosidase